MAVNEAHADSDEAALAARAAWLYYVEDLTQAEVAKRLGLAPLKAHRIIAQATRSGLVRVFVDGPISGCMELERSLREKFGLQYCRVVPSATLETALPLRAVGRAAAGFLTKLLDLGEHKVIGVGHGRTLAAMVSEMPSHPAPAGVRFISLLGSLPHVMAANPYDVIYRLADKTSADADVMPVPFLANTAEDRAVLMRQDGVAKTLQAAATATLFLVGIGEVGGDAFLPASSTIVAREVMELQRAGAVGETLGCYFDQDGQLLDTPLHDKVVALPPEALRGHHTVGVAGGSGKAPAILSILRSGLLTGLITDEATARSLVASPTHRVKNRGQNMQPTFKKTAKKSALAAVTALCTTLAVAGTGLVSGTAAFAATDVANVKVAFLMPDEGSTRYEEHDRPGFVAEMKKLCPTCQVLYQNADADASRQQQQFNSVISQGAKAIVIDPVDSTAAASLVKQAQSQGIKIIAYDRPIPSAKADYYVSFNNEQIGKSIAQSLIEHLKATNVAAGDVGLLEINGSPTDAAAGLIKKGVHEGLANSGYKTLAEYDTPEWQPSKAQQWASGQVTRFNKKIVGVVAANDGTAGGAIAAFKAAGMDPVPPVTGNDATIAGLQLIIAGDQYNTIVKPSEIVAAAAANIAIELLKGETPKSNTTLFDTPTQLFVPALVTSGNLKSEIIDKEVAGKPIETAAILCTGRYAEGCGKLGIAP